MEFKARYQDPNNEGNSSKYHTGKECIEVGCNNPAGTAWSPHWCFECNVKRMDSVTARVEQIAKLMQSK